MMMRRRGPGLVGAAARTAVVVGTANAVSHRQRERYEAQDEQQEQAQQAPAAPAAPAADDVAAQIEALAKLHAEGILTDEEFSAKKAQLLGI